MNDLLPTPLRPVTNLVGPITGLADARSNIVAYVREENAERRNAIADGIVRAVNCHAELVAALQNFIDTVQLVDPGVYSDSIDQARAAISIAESPCD